MSYGQIAATIVLTGIGVIVTLGCAVVSVYLVKFTIKAIREKV